MAELLATDRSAKHARVRSILEERGANALHLSQPQTLAWYFDGARVAVPLGGPPVFSAIVHADGAVEVTALANEADRLRAEELGPDVDINAWPWHVPLPDPPAGVVPDTAVSDELRAARASLLPVERARYAALGVEVATLVTQALTAAVPTLSERELAADLMARVVACGAELVVLLVAGESRLHIPHPLPSAASLGRRAVVAVGARRHGMVANVTRSVSWGLSAPHEAALRRVEAAAFAATVPGRELAQVLSDIADAYAVNGLGEDAWLRHHQGGPTGYLGRDPKVTPQCHETIASGQAFAWNPWIPGAKLEDTVIVDRGGVDVLTVDPAWPTIDVDGIARPLTLNDE